MSTTQPPAARATRSGEGAARVAQSALLREVPATVAAGRLATRYVSAAAETRVGGDLLEIVSDKGHPRWLIGDTRGKGLPAVRLASVAMTSFRDACAQPGLSLPEIARVVDRSVTQAAPHRPAGSRRRAARPAPGPYRAQARRRRRGAAIRSGLPAGPARRRARCGPGTRPVTPCPAIPRPPPRLVSWAGRPREGGDDAGVRCEPPQNVGCRPGRGPV